MVSKIEFTNSKNNEGVQALLRGLELLRALAQVSEGATVRELSAALGLKEPTAYKLLQTLVGAGFVTKSGRPVRYRLGPGVGELAERYWQNSLLTRAEAVLVALAARFVQWRANIVLTEALAGEVEIVLRLTPDQPGVIERPRGRVMPAYASACPLVFQAFWSAAERAEYQRRHPFWEEGAYLWQTSERLEATLAAIRRLGYAVAPWPDRQLHLLAAPVRGPRGELRAVLGVSIPSPPPDAATCQTQIDCVLQAAGQLAASQE